MCLVIFWKCYFPPPPTQNPPPHNRKTTKTPPPTPPQQQQKNQRSKRESKKSKSQINFITKISNENENEIGNGFASSWCDLRFMGSRCDRRSAARGSWVHGAMISSSWVRGFVVRLAGGATNLGFLGSRSLSLSVCAWVLFLSLSLFARLQKWFEGKILAENIFQVKGLNFTVN